MTGKHTQGHYERECFELADCEIEAETARALLVKTEANLDGWWIPLSQVEKIERNAKAKFSSTIRMSAWIARQKGIA